MSGKSRQNDERCCRIACVHCPKHIVSAEVQAAVAAVSTVGGAFAAHPAAAEADLELAAVPVRKVKVDSYTRQC